MQDLFSLVFDCIFCSLEIFTDLNGIFAPVFVILLLILIIFLLQRFLHA